MYSFVPDPDDHCESPQEAYGHIEICLSLLAIEMNKSREELFIYDPYFCEGQVINNLSQIGFTNVYNKNEDFYQIWKDKKYPNFDCIVTNPPYSGDHMEKLIQFCISMKKPWFLLLPNFVYTKSYYMNMVTKKVVFRDMTFYITPKKRYKYTTPKGRRQQKSATYTSPFPTFWYCNLYRYTPKILHTIQTEKLLPSTIDLTIDINNLPIDILPEEDNRKKRLRNAQKRDKHKKRKKLNQSLITS